MSQVKVESVVITSNQHGHVATILFNVKKHDKIISSSNKNKLYMLIEEHVQKATGHGKPNNLRIPQ